MNTGDTGMKAGADSERQPWALGPMEILQHGISLLGDDGDAKRRLALLSIDNAVELMLQTFLGLPARVHGIRLSRRELEETCESFPRLLDAIHQHAPEKLEGIDLAQIEWFHRLRNQLYHNGNGLTVERRKVEDYAEIARNLFRKLFGFDLELDRKSYPVMFSKPMPLAAIGRSTTLVAKG